MTRADEMREMFDRWKGSGQSLMAFGKEEGVSYAKLLYWRRKLGGAARRVETAATTTTPAPGLVPVTIVPDATVSAARAGVFEVWLSNGVSLDVAPGFDASELRRLVGVLRSC